MMSIIFSAALIAVTLAVIAAIDYGMFRFELRMSLRKARDAVDRHTVMLAAAENRFSELTSRSNSRHEDVRSSLKEWGDAIGKIRIAAATAKRDRRWPGGQDGLRNRVIAPIETELLPAEAKSMSLLRRAERSFESFERQRISVCEAIERLDSLKDDPELGLRTVLVRLKISAIREMRDAADRMAEQRFLSEAARQMTFTYDFANKSLNETHIEIRFRHDAQFDLERLERESRQAFEMSRDHLEKSAVLRLRHMELAQSLTVAKKAFELADFGIANEAIASCRGRLDDFHRLLAQAVR
jgi:hypothetical protein